MRGCKHHDTIKNQKITNQRGSGGAVFVPDIYFVMQLGALKNYTAQAEIGRNQITYDQTSTSPSTSTKKKTDVSECQKINVLPQPESSNHPFE